MPPGGPAANVSFMDLGRESLSWANAACILNIVYPVILRGTSGEAKDPYLIPITDAFRNVTIGQCVLAREPRTDNQGLVCRYMQPDLIISPLVRSVSFTNSWFPEDCPLNIHNSSRVVLLRPHKNYCMFLVAIFGKISQERAAFFIFQLFVYSKSEIQWHWILVDNLYSRIQIINLPPIASLSSS